MYFQYHRNHLCFQYHKAYNHSDILSYFFLSDFFDFQVLFLSEPEVFLFPFFVLQKQQGQLLFRLLQLFGLLLLSVLQVFLFPAFLVLVSHFQDFHLLCYQLLHFHLLYFHFQLQGFELQVLPVHALHFFLLFLLQCRQEPVPLIPVFPPAINYQLFFWRKILFELMLFFRYYL